MVEDLPGRSHDNMRLVLRTVLKVHVNWRTFTYYYNEDNILFGSKISGFQQVNKRWNTHNTQVKKRSVMLSISSMKKLKLVGGIIECEIKLVIRVNRPPPLVLVLTCDWQDGYIKCHPFCGPGGQNEYPCYRLQYIGVDTMLHNSCRYHNVIDHGPMTAIIFPSGHYLFSLWNCNGANK